MKYLGVDYYPEQWGMELVDEDLDNIVELGANLIRIGDFAWDRFEPEDGVYDFSFFDEVIRKAKKRGLKILMCVPGASVPSWLYRKHPEIMNVDERGYRQPFGARRGHCFNNDIYRQKVLNLAEVMAEHYKGEEAIVAWQVENEIGHEGSDMCYCDACQRKFRDHLRNKYKDIKELNERWGTSFWNQTYYDFDDVPLPRPSFVAQNPSLRLEWERFRSISARNIISDMAYRVRIITDFTTPVTHDFEGGTINKHFSPFEVATDLDFVSYNNYPVWGGQPAPMSESDLAFSVDFARGFIGSKIWVTEAIMGQQGHNDIGYAPKPDEAKKWALSSLDHGVETVIFFRYRGFTKGAEQFCFGILDADNVKRRKYYETQSFFKEVKDKDISYPKSDVCLVYDFDSKSSMAIQRQSDVFDYEKECQKLYRQLYIRGLNCDIISSDRSFSEYKLVILPYMIIMSDEFKTRLKKYVRKGGKVLFTARTAWKDLDNNLVFGKRLPIDLDDLTGCVIEEHESLLSGQSSKLSYDGKQGEGYVFEELLKTTTGKELIKWEDNPFGEYSAVVDNGYGSGKSYYMGTSLDEDSLNSLFDEILKSA
ncbi:MAG: beta-galactosidase [Erysipelotrichaceae bacterium]|nr:beta-galactosidase [Erysipelotrichaceae bacterium]